MKAGRHLEKAAEKYSKAAESWGPGDKSLLLFFASEKDMVPAFKLPHFMNYFFEDEPKMHLACEKLEALGLLQIIEPHSSPFRATTYRIMPLGELTAKRLDIFERENGYPMLDEIVAGALKGRYPKIDAPNV